MEEPQMAKTPKKAAPPAKKRASCPDELSDSLSEPLAHVTLAPGKTRRPKVKIKPPNVAEKAAEFAQRQRPKALTKDELAELVPDHETHGLSLLELRFVGYYILAEGNGTEAAMRAKGFSKRTTAAKWAIEMLKVSRVAEAIESWRMRFFEDVRQQARQKVLKVLFSRAFYDPAKLLTQDGELAEASLDEIPEELRYCIDGIEEKATKFGTNKVIKLADRMQAIAKLIENTAMFADVKDDGKGRSMTEDTAKQLADMFAGIG